MLEESIYNAIPLQRTDSPRAPRHKSKHNPKVAPTGSTIGLKNTSSKVVNMKGNIFVGQTHSRYGEARDFGYPPNFWQESGKVCNSIQLQNSKIKLPSLRTAKSQMNLKPVVPKDKPVQGLSSGTDFLNDNMNINKSISRKTKLMEVRSSQSIENKRDMNKNPMGTVPKYLDNRKKQIEQEYDTKLNQYKAMEEQTMATEVQPLSEDELEVLRERLQTKLDNLSHIYQGRAHKRFFNSEWETKRREDLEKQIETLKAYLQKLYKPYVFVDHKNQDSKIAKLK